MDKVFSPEKIESKWYQFWEDSEFFTPRSGDDAYCIMLPPPNVTGSLHMGHAFQDTLMDTLIRYHRMQGHQTLWQAGTDHAGIATQMVVERQLLKEGKSRHDLGREAFVNRIWDWKAESGNTIYQQMRRLGASVDWSRERFTMDDGLSEAVREVFVRLFDEGLIYRGKRLVNWDPKLHTAVSDLEVISTEEQGHLWHLRYPIEGSEEHMVVATTRPETMLGDSAVAVHPEDSRYAHLVGKQIKLPLCDRLIPIIADDYVDPEFGSGCVKITPAHDFNDYEVGQRHDLPLINVFDDNAHLNDDVPPAYRGLERYEARKQILADLEAKGLIEKIDDHTLKVPRGDRSGVVVEPYLTDQWYVKTAPLAKPAIEAVENGDIKFVPSNWSKTYFEWMNNIQDWCISRQLWWGHRIPAWYDNDGNVYVAVNEVEARQKYHLSADVELFQDEDVLDTWFSSALWPFSTLGWPENTKELETYYPTSVLVTGFDIIFFWVARMIMMGLKFTDKVPFKTVYVHGLIQDPEGQKMSKSKGNVLDPLDFIDGIDLDPLVKKRTQFLMQPEMAKKVEKLTKKQFPEGIDKHGTDPLRFTFLALATTGRHIRFDLSRLETYRNFCNKLWNASRYVFMQLEQVEPSDAAPEPSLSDRWILSRLQTLKAEVKQHFEEYRFDLLATALYEFTWHHLCDWYLELSKPILNSEESTPGQKKACANTLIKVLDEVLRLMHPLIPFITEEIWQRLTPFLGLENQSICIQPYPSVDPSHQDEGSEQALEWVKSAISGIRNIRGEMNISPAKPLDVLYRTDNANEQSILMDNKALIQFVAKVGTIEAVSDQNLNQCATALCHDTELFVQIKGLVDVDAETTRLKKEIDKHQKELSRSNAKLGNEKFVSSAPAHIVDEEKRRADESQSTISTLQKRLDMMEQLSD